MNKRIIVGLLSFLLIIALLITKSKYLIILTILTISINFFLKLYERLRIIKEEDDLEFELRKNSYELKFIYLILALIPTIGYFINGKINYFQISVFWTIFAWEIISYFLLKNKKPIDFYIKDTEIVSADIFSRKWNIEKLEKIELNGLTNIIEFTFLNSSKLQLKRDSYSVEKINELIEICKRKKIGEINISDNLK